MAGYNGAWTGQQIDEAVRQVTNKDLPADGVKFTDGQTFQQKYNAGQLTDPAGAPGADGYTPEKGVDYYTDADKQEMVQSVIAALPVYNGEVE